MNISIKATQLEFAVELINNPTSKAIFEALPVESTVNTWGDEIYFDSGIDAPDLGGTTDVSVGDVAYWPEGKCLCVFFGPTPMSSGNKPVPASSVVVIGRTDTLPEELKKVPSGAKISVDIQDPA